MKPPLIGKKFNHLTVIEHKSRYEGYICLCDCGNKTIARSWALKTGKHKSCGCKQQELRIQKRILPNFQALKNELYKNYKDAAKRRQYSFTISKKRFLLLTSSNCEYCGQEPNMPHRGNKRKIMDTSSYRCNGVDRKDNTKGYTTKNCVSCCKICNNSKNTLTEKEWLDWVNKIYNYQNKKRFND